jgi:hypothetical protein
MTDLMSLLYDTGDPQVITLPSGKTATILEMTGLDQRNFSDRAKVSNGTALNELLERCVDSIDGEKPTKEYLLDMLSGDRKTLMFNIRRYSLGNDFTFSSKCPNCGEPADWEVPLLDSDFPIKNYKVTDSKSVEAPSKLRPGLVWKFQMLDGHAELKAIKLRNKATAMSDLDLRQIQAKVEDGQYSPVALDKLGDKLITELRGIIKDHEGEIDDHVSLTCAKCQVEAGFNLMGVPDFLIPGATS